MRFKTDMADERRDLYKKANNLEDEIEGIECELEELEYGIHLTRVKILNEKGENALQKKKGNYITIDLKKAHNVSDENKERIIDVVSVEIKKLIDNKIKEEDEVLVVGLGNGNLIADALGTKVINNIEITRHIKKYYPEYLKDSQRAISAIAPGVMGTTGIETIEVIKGIVQNIKPKLIIVIDSLASRSMERIVKSIQISDTGIVPGGGVGNKQNELTIESLGVPVIAVGIPTVVETAVLVNDVLNLFIEKLQDEAKSTKYLNELKEQDNYENVKEILNPNNYNMIVTPKEIDDLIENMKDIIASGINFSI